MYVSECLKCVLCLCGCQKEGSVPGAEVTGNGEPSDVGAENHTQVFRRAVAPLTAGPPPRPHLTTADKSDGRTPASIPCMVTSAGHNPGENLSSKI